MIIDKSTGKKFGKSEGNAVWLDAEKTSPYAFYQFWLNVSDINVIDYLKLFTFLTLSEIENIEREHADNPNLRVAQKVLAREITTFVHGAETTNSVTKVSEILFEGGDVNSLLNEEVDILLTNAPTYEVEGSHNVVDILIGSSLVTSKREAREFIASGAITLNQDKVIDEALVVKLNPRSIATLRRGKKQFVVLVGK